MGPDGKAFHDSAAVTERRYRALPAQYGMIMNTLRFPDDGIDIQQVTLDWADSIEPTAFEAAWHDAARRHSVLRTAFALHGQDGLVQVVDPAATIDIRWRDLPPLPAFGPDEPFEAFLRADRHEPFDITKSPLIRLTILRRSDGTAGTAGPAPARRVVLTFHHALLDGRSLPLLVNEVCEAYTAARDGRDARHPDRPHFHEFVTWWQSTDPSSAEQFWTGYLADTVLPRPLPGYRGRSTGGQSQAATSVTVLPADISDQIRSVARDAELSASTMVTAAWALLRAAYGGVCDVVFAVTRSCRYGSMAGAEDVIGLLINTVPMRVRIDPLWTVADLLAAVNDGIRSIRDHQLTAMSSILAWAALPADTPLLDTLVVFERRSLQNSLPGGEGRPSAARMDRLPSYPLTVHAFDEPDMQLGVIWDRRQLVDGAAERMLAQLRAVLIEMACSLGTPLAELSLGAADESKIHADWNHTAERATYPRDATIPELFAAQLARDPHAPALVADAQTLTYAELDARARQLANALLQCGARPDEAIAVVMPRSADLIVTLLAVVMAGGAYLPIDPASPPARIATLVTAATVRMVLVTAESASAIPQLDGVETARVDQLGAGQPDADQLDADQPRAGGTTDGLVGRSHPLSLAYISFTSGSTGVPKGVAVPHRAVVRLVSDQSFASFGPGERLLQLAPVAFDASTLEIWGALLTGATLVLAPAGPLGLPEVAAVLRDGGVTLAWLTGGLFHQLVEADPTALAGVRQILAGGDVLNPDAVRAALTARGGQPIINGYGPTENTTFTTCHRMSDVDEVGAAVPIGRPIAHTSVHILDPDGRPVPIGVAGELFAGGDGLARGYAHNPAATARSFVPDPNGTGARLYRTGDLARWRADGVLEFLGRVDNQIKIRGFRVEPGEIEAVLRTLPGVRDCVVVVRGEGAQRRLIGYATRVEGLDPADLRPAALREFLAARLPDYLVPAAFAVLDGFPLNANGKVDRAALPMPEREKRATSSPPQGPTEQRLAEIWRQLLPADALPAAGLGREDSFFALGGNSLSAARLMFRVQDAFGIDLRLGAFYEGPTLARCAALIDAAGPQLASASMASPTIGRRSRDAYRVSPGGVAAASASTTASSEPPAVSAPVASLGIARRDRRAFRVPEAAPQPGGPDQHLVPLTEEWALWRTVCLRGTGLPADLVTSLSDAPLAAVADAVLAARDGAALGARGPGDHQAEAAFTAEFGAAVGRLSVALHAAAGLPALREAVAWQNRHALTTGLDALRRHGPTPANRNTKHRQHEALIASYLQRYCMKNDTIGFFGPVSWSAIDDGRGVRIVHSGSDEITRARTTYLEGWAVRAVMAEYESRLRPWLVPRRMPFTGVEGATLRLPLAPPIPMTPAEAAVLRACDGVRDAMQIAASVLTESNAGLADAASVFEILERLREQHRIAWQIDVAPQDIRPERTMAALLARVGDDSVRRPAEAALTEVTTARDALASAAGDAQAVATAMAELEATFTRLTGASPTRRAGGLYAGRTLAYEECLRADEVRIGIDAFDGVRDALGLVLRSSRWFTAACGELYGQRFTEVYRKRAAELGSEIVPFVDFWLLANDALFDPDAHLIQPAVRGLQQRWSSIIGTPMTGRRIQLSAVDLRERVHQAFDAGPLPWPAAVHHSPDLMIAGDPTGRFAWVLGEIHPSLVTMRYATWLDFHDDPATMRSRLRADLGGRGVFLAETGEDGGVNSRLSNVLASPDDLRLVFAHDSCGYDPSITLVAGDCDLIETPAGLRLRRRDGAVEIGLLEAVGDLLTTALAQAFHPLPRGAHTPRVTIDDLVVGRELWRLPAIEPDFADVKDEQARYLRARSWARRHGLPSHVFVRFSGERKPIYADLTSLASIDLLARGLRRARRDAGDDASVTVVEMLPAPDQTWLVDAGGRRYSAELRMVAVDLRQRG